MLLDPRYIVDPLYILEGPKGSHRISPTAIGFSKFKDLPERYKDIPESIKTIEEALEWCLKNHGLKDAGFENQTASEWHKRVRDNLPGLKSLSCLTRSQAFYLLTGIDIEKAIYLFKFNEQIHFTMRLEYGEMCLKYDLDKEDNSDVKWVNVFEEKIYDSLCDYGEEIEAICRAISEKKISLDKKTEEAPFDDWLSLFQTLNSDQPGLAFRLPHIPQEYLPKPIADSDLQKMVARCPPSGIKTNPDQQDEYVVGNSEIEAESGMNITTFLKWAKLAGIEIQKTDDPCPKNKVKKSDIRRVVKYRKENKK